MTDTSSDDAGAQPSNGGDDPIVPTTGDADGGGPDLADDGESRERADGGDSVAADRDHSPGPDADRIVYYAQLAAFLILAILALVATFRFYLAASDAIGTWISRDFVSVFQAAFNLVVLVLSVLGLSLLVRRMRSE